jgi:hypothetical protein
MYPKNLPQLDVFLSSNGDPNVSPEHGHPIAFNSLLQESRAYEIPPTFLGEDSEEAATDPRIAGRTSIWMAISRQVAVGNRRRVLENGEDKMNSEDEEDEEMKPDELTGMYTPEMDPKAGLHKLSQSEAARQRAMFQARKEQMILSAPRVESPQPGEVPEVVNTHVNMLLSGGSSDDDDLSRPEHVWSNTLGKVRKNKAWTRKLADAELALPAPEPDRHPTPISSDTEDQSFMTEDQKRIARPAQKKAGVGKSVTRSRAVTDPTSPSVSMAAASPRAPAGIPTKGQQAPKQPVEGQESPGTKVPTPTMVTRRQASRAGGLRPVGGSGQTDTRVACRNPSKT